MYASVVKKKPAIFGKGWTVDQRTEEVGEMGEGYRGDRRGGHIKKSYIKVNLKI